MVLTLVRKWFECWEKGNLEELPIAPGFIHISPYGRIEGRDVYLRLVKDNLDKFLGHTFEIHELIGGDSVACCRYTASKDDFKLEVSEWHYMEEEQITKVIAYYDIPREAAHLDYPESAE